MQVDKVTLVFDANPLRTRCDIDYHRRDLSFSVLHDHDYWEFFAVIRGKCTHYINNKQYVMQSNDCVFIRPADVHYFTKDSSDFDYINILFRDCVVQAGCGYLIPPPTLYNELLGKAILTYKLNHAQSEHILNYCSLILASLNDTQHNRFIARMLCAYLLEMFEYNESAVSLPDWLNSILVAINKTPAAELNINDLIKDIPYSHQYINRRFKQLMGKPLITYINEVKLNHACELLQKNNASILDTCNDIGFYSVSHFNHLFKQYYGMSPKQYQKQFRQ